jgi:hypothetical protein
LEQTRARLVGGTKFPRSIFKITLLSAEARAVTESETEAERLRAQARRALELARDVTGEEAARALKVHAAELLARADALERKGET